MPCCRLTLDRQYLQLKPEPGAVVERGLPVPLSEKKVRALAEDLGENPDLLLALSGRTYTKTAMIFRNGIRGRSAVVLSIWPIASSGKRLPAISRQPNHPPPKNMPGMNFRGSNITPTWRLLPAALFWGGSRAFWGW